MSLKHGDLKDNILPIISIDEFEPKAGDIKDVIVVGFYLKDEPPAKDLNRFIQRSAVDTLSVEVSPNTDNEGRYLVFVEIARNPKFPDIFKVLIKDVENLSGDVNWIIRTYLGQGRDFTLSDEDLFQYVILNPLEYVTKEKFMKESIEQKVSEFLKDSYISDLQVNDSCIKLNSSNKIIEAEFVDVGDYDVVVGRNFLNESAFKLTQVPFEARMLGSILGNYNVSRIDDFYCVSKQHDDNVMLLKNVQIKY